MSVAPSITGIGLRQPHGEALLAGLEGGTLQLPFVEVHSENYFGDGGAALELLQRVRAHCPVSLHGVGLALGSAAGLDSWHLERLAMLAERIDPVRVSDHACFARVPQSGAVVHAADLLPIAFTPAALDILACNVMQVQERLRRPIAVENLAAYLAWADDALPEPEFFNALVRRTGCHLLLDVNNLVVNALNDGADPVAAACAWVDAIDANCVAEIHLAGYDDAGEIVVDDHGSRVHAPVWQVFAHALRRLGPVPALVEWDNDLPALELLVAEARQADRLACR